MPESNSQAKKNAAAATVTAPNAALVALVDNANEKNQAQRMRLKGLLSINNLICFLWQLNCLKTPLIFCKFERAHTTSRRDNLLEKVFENVAGRQFGKS